MNKNAILKKYLGFWPAWFDLRKKEILKDNIDIKQWQINMNYLIYKYGTIDKSEQRAFEDWVAFNVKDGEEYEEYSEKKITPILLYISFDVPPILREGQDRNWFLAAYPDIFDYFYPQMNYENDFDIEMPRIEQHIEKITDEFERMEKYALTGKGNQTTYLIRMKNFYRYELNRNFLLTKK